MPKTSALNELLDSTQPMLDPANSMPPVGTPVICECQSCPEHDPDEIGAQCKSSLTDPVTGEAAGGYLVERAGYSCYDCLPMMIEIGLAMTADAVEPEQNEPTYVRVANFLPNAPTFS